MAEGGPGATQDVVTALLAVPGVADASITPDRRLGGAGTLHLTLLPGADEIGVANAVNRVLREHFGLAVDTDNVSIVDEASPVRLSSVPATAFSPTPTSQQGPAEPRQQATQPVVRGPGLSAVPVLAADGPDDNTHDAIPDDASPEAPREATRADADAGAPPDEDENEAADGAAAEGEVAATPVDLTAGEPDPAAHPVRGPRLLIERMQLVAADLGVETEVTLGFSGGHWTGYADGAATPTAVHRAVAAATLDAVQQCVDGGMRLELEHLEVPSLGSERAVVVEVSLVTRRGAERLTGVSAVRDDVRQAVIRATLDALNRRLESVLVPA